MKRNWKCSFFLYLCRHLVKANNTHALLTQHKEAIVDFLSHAVLKEKKLTNTITNVWTSIITFYTECLVSNISSVWTNTHAHNKTKTIFGHFSCDLCRHRNNLNRINISWILLQNNYIENGPTITILLVYATFVNGNRNVNSSILDTQQLIFNTHQSNKWTTIYTNSIYIPEILSKYTLFFFVEKK